MPNGATATYHLHAKTNSVPLNRGVRPYPLSSKLFTLALEDVFKELDWSKRQYLNNLRYADIVIISS